MIKQKALEFIIIQMEKFTKEILKKINGNGIYYYECGDKYEGNCIMVTEMFIMENGKIVKKNGKGIIVYKSGNKYDGYWEDGKRVVKEFIILKMEIFLKENGKMEKKWERSFLL